MKGGFLLEVVRGCERIVYDMQEIDRKNVGKVGYSTKNNKKSLIGILKSHRFENPSLNIVLNFITQLVKLQL